MIFRGYISRRAWARAKLYGLGRFIRRFPGECRRAIRHIWWRWTSERGRVVAERDRLRVWGEDQFKRAREAEHAVWTLKVEHRGADIDLLRLVADEIDCGGNAHDCDYCGLMDWSTGVTECPRSDNGECSFERACQLRDLAKALETYAAAKAVDEDSTAAA